MKIFKRELGFTKRKILMDAEKYVSKPIKHGDLYYLKVKTNINDEEFTETRLAHYNVIRRERARLLAWTALQLMGYEEDDIAEALNMKNIYTLSSAARMLTVGLRELGFGN